MKNDAAQADNGYPMMKAGALTASATLKDVSIGTVRFDQPGLKIIRFVSTVAKQQVKVDRIRLVEAGAAASSTPKPPVKKQAVPPAPKPGGKAHKIMWASLGDWSRERPGFEWAFPFIDRNRDGKIDETEYDALQQYKKKHGKAWRDQARKELKARQ